MLLAGGSVMGWPRVTYTDEDRRGLGGCPCCRVRYLPITTFSRHHLLLFFYPTKRLLRGSASTAVPQTRACAPAVARGRLGGYDPILLCDEHAADWHRRQPRWLR